MIEVATVEATALDRFRELHNRYVDRDESIATVRKWHEDHPRLLVGAFDGDELVGHALGLAPDGDGGAVELAGLSVVESHRRRGIGSRLVAAIERRAATAGYDRITLGSAGGYVDEFYLASGYAAESILVRLDGDRVDGPVNDPGDLPATLRPAAYRIDRVRRDGATLKLYVAVADHDPAPLDAVRAAFGDPDAIYVLEKEIDGN
ncbi:hypothetical protein BRD17_08195 [Halobacteriales archaeon SW_7_68_16]|nr:MAG: hypothetical protein BRD17_08195 [Halobacteriales archaeon SW_7_68_16]